MGERVNEFERAFAHRLMPDRGSDITCLAVSSGTMALYLAIAALELEPGDEVIVPALTFVAAANVVRLHGGVPVFADIESADNLNISVSDIESKLSARTRAIMLVHFAGFACDMGEIVSLCRKHQLPLIEDCAHAPGALWQGRALGSFGDISCFSFYANKNLSTGEGGMVCSTDSDLSIKLKRMRTHGMDRLSLSQQHGRAAAYNVIEPSVNARFDEMRAAIGLVQLEKLESMQRERELMFDIYAAELPQLGVVVPFAQQHASREGGVNQSAYHIMTVVLPPSCLRDTVVAVLRENQIQTSVHYPPFWTFDAYSTVEPSATPEFQQISSRLLTLPLSGGFSADEQSRIISVMALALDQRIANNQSG